MAKEYNIAKTAGACCRCGKQLEPGAELLATICESAEPENEGEFVRLDYCPDCWHEVEDAPPVPAAGTQAAPSPEPPGRPAPAEPDARIEPDAQAPSAEPAESAEPANGPAAEAAEAEPLAQAVAGPPLAAWRTRVPQPKEKKKLFIDDELLVNFFQRLEGTEEPAKRDFRFVLALILMRKKLVNYDSSKPLPDGGEEWIVRCRGSEDTYAVYNPELTEDRIVEVSEKLSDILEGEL